MPRVVFMCDPAGAGKTKLARRLEAAGMTRLSHDQEAWNRGLRVMPLPEETRDEIARHLRRRLIQLLEQGRDVVLDFSFWSRAMRDGWRRLVAEEGIAAETIYMPTDRETFWTAYEREHITTGTTSSWTLTSRPTISITSSRPRKTRAADRSLLSPTAVGCLSLEGLSAKRCFWSDTPAQLARGRS